MIASKPVLHFAHGNGFPSPCYRQMLKPLEAFFDCCYIDKIGHADAFPVEDNWTALVDELCASVRAQSKVPVFAVGHSLGGVLSVLAALKAPELFHAVVLLDAPLLSQTRSRALKWFKATGLIDKITPAGRTRARRSHWEDKEEMRRYFRRRELFKRFDAACLEDYIEYGMKHDETGYCLRFNPAIEYQIYRTIPHELQQTPKTLTVPTTLIYGDQSDVVHMLDRRYMSKKYGIQMLKTKGTHMFPFEYPMVTANTILAVLQKTHR